MTPSRRNREQSSVIPREVACFHPHCLLWQCIPASSTEGTFNLVMGDVFCGTHTCTLRGFTHGTLVLLRACPPELCRYLWEGREEKREVQGTGDLLLINRPLLCPLSMHTCSSVLVQLCMENVLCSKRSPLVVEKMQQKQCVTSDNCVPSGDIWQE